MGNRLNYISREDAVEIVLSRYVGEPCRICGVKLTRKDIETAVYAGYSKNDEARSAHKTYWEKNIPQEKWVYND